MTTKYLCIFEDCDQVGTHLHKGGLYCYEHWVQELKDDQAAPVPTPAAKSEMPDDPICELCGTELIHDGVDGWICDGCGSTYTQDLKRNPDEFDALNDTNYFERGELELEKAGLTLADLMPSEPPAAPMTAYDLRADLIAEIAHLEKSEAEFLWRAHAERIVIDEMKAKLAALDGEAK